MSIINNWLRFIAFLTGMMVVVTLGLIILAFILESFILGAMVFISCGLKAEKVEFYFNHDKRPSVISPVITPGHGTDLERWTR